MPDVEGQDRFPLVVTIHGGGFQGGSKASTAFVSNQFAQRGYIVASINYRLNGDDPVPSSRFQAVHDAVGGASVPAQVRAAFSAMDDTLTALDFLHARPQTCRSEACEPRRRIELLTCSLRGIPAPSGC
ncbi:MAG TPA: carboxylesterase family protein [Acidimicrobiales bacterium]|nr:carboxylesterase family protein [Acidimicrobiales bacterium]